jgi:hypothetical protein
MDRMACWSDQLLSAVGFDRSQLVDELRQSTAPLTDDSAGALAAWARATRRVPAKLSGHKCTCVLDGDVILISVSDAGDASVEPSCVISSRTCRLQRSCVRLSEEDGRFYTSTGPAYCLA